MMNEILIGRKVEGPFDIIVPESYSKVSRKHAKILIQEKNIRLKDLDSGNGTYVNGKRISTTAISINDTIVLGDRNAENGFKLDVNKVIEDINQIKLASKTDFKDKFQELKIIYQHYLEEKNKIKQKIQRKNQIPKIAISVLLGIVILILYSTKSISPEDGKLIYPLMMIISAATGFSSFIGNKPDISDTLIDIDIKYQSQYKCPKCKKPYNLNTHWKKLENNKTCPHGCGAVFSG